jgi:gliding motility-associated-like protein
VRVGVFHFKSGIMVNKITVVCIFVMLCTACGEQKNDLFFIPDTFSPNSDMVNDCFCSIHTSDKWGITLARFKMSIYDAENMRVYYSEDVNECWCGIYNGLPAPSGTYSYHIIYETDLAPGEEKQIWGDVTLIR